MKLITLLAVLLVSTLFLSSLAQEFENSEFGSGSEVDYSGKGSSEDGDDDHTSVDTPGLDEDEEKNNKIGNNFNENKGDDMDFGAEDQPGSSTEVRTSESRDGHKQFSIKHPAVLALIIGGIIFVLLIILLLVMFVVYRLRKKDEGSYALDENMKKKSRNIVYTKPPLQNEFFA